MGKNRKLGFIVLLLAFSFASCSSPENEGMQMAQCMNECAENFIREKQNAESDFENRFNASDYSSRTEAMEAYDKAMIAVLDEYKSCHDEAEVKKSQIAGQYSDDYKKLSAFETAYQDNIDVQLEQKVLDEFYETDYPAAVLAKVKMVIPVKPDDAKIQKDLVGHQLTEGFEKEKCWFSEDYRWTIGEGEIRDFKIEEVMRNDDKKYVFVATMRLEGKLNAFNVRAKISYWLPDTEDWKLEFVNSLGVSIVKTHEYDDCVSFEIKDDGWGGVDALFITNKTELELGVGVEIVANGHRRRYAVRVSPDKKAQVGGVFGGGNVTSYDVEFVERF